MTSILYPPRLFSSLGGDQIGGGKEARNLRNLTDAVKMLAFLIVREAVARGLVLARRFICAG